MTDVNAPYPPAAEAVDQALARAIDTLRETTTHSISALQATLTEGLSRVERRMDDLVTKGEFAATVSRLDAKDDQLDTKIETGFQSIRREVSEGFQDVKDDDRERNTKNRWFWGVMVAFAGVVSGVVFGVINLISS